MLSLLKIKEYFPRALKIKRMQQSIRARNSKVARVSILAKPEPSTT